MLALEKIPVTVDDASRRRLLVPNITLPPESARVLPPPNSVLCESITPAELLLVTEPPARKAEGVKSPVTWPAVPLNT
jgi:hypothetical protein